MTHYNTSNVKLCNSWLIKLKSGAGFLIPFHPLTNFDIQQ